MEKADDDGVHAHGLTGTGGTRNQQVGHFGNIAHHAGTVNALAQGYGGLGLGVCKLA